MQFQKSTTEFPTKVHKRIHIAALGITPLEVSLANTGSIDRDLIESCRAYHGFIISMLSDMYENPLVYGMNAGEYDSFLNGKKENGMKQRSPSKTLELRSITYNCVSGYLRLLMRIAIAGKPGEKGMTLALSDFTEIKKEFDRNLAPKKKTIFNSIPYQTRVDALARVGFIISESDEKVVITSENYSNMFTAMSELAKSMDNVKTFGEHNFCNCEFRQIFSGYTPRYEDVIRPLDEDKRKIFDTFHKYALDMKMCPTCHTYWKVNYKWKNAQIIQIGTEGNKGRLWITGAAGNNPDEKAWLNSMLAEQPPEFQKYALSHLHYCTGCSTSHLGGFTTVLGKRKRVCGGGAINFHIYDPEAHDVEYFKKFIEMKRELVLKSNGKKAK